MAGVLVDPQGRTLATEVDLGAKWLYTTTNGSGFATGPKHEAVRLGKDAGHKFFVERQTAGPAGRTYRKWSSYPNVGHLASEIGTANHHLFEVIPPDNPCKLYFDLEDKTVKEQGRDVRVHVDIVAFVERLRQCYERYFDNPLPANCIFVTESPGIDKGRVWKQSYHVTCFDTFAMPSCKEVGKLCKLWFADMPFVDKAPYQNYQSYRMLNQSKAGSTRTLAADQGIGGYWEHSASSFRTKPKIFNMGKLEKVLRREDGVRIAANQVPDYIATTECPVEIDPDEFDADDGAHLLKVIPNTGEGQTRQVWMTVGLAANNSGVPYAAFQAWSAQSSKYGTSGRDESRRLYDVPRKVDGYNLDTLRKVAKKSRPGLLATSSNIAVAQCMYPTIDFEAQQIPYSFHFHQEDTHWLGDILPEWDAHPHLILRSAMGTGKTTQVCAALKVLAPKSTLIITNRCTLAATSMGTYGAVLPGLVHYKKVKDWSKADHVVCQLESLWKVKRSYDFIIYDECESILHQFMSSTAHKHFNEILATFEKVTRAAKRTLWADAFVTDRSIVTCKELTTGGMKFLWNKKQPLKRRAIQLSPCREPSLSGTRLDIAGCFQKCISKLRDAGKTIFFVCAWNGILMEVEPYLPQPARLIHGKTTQGEKEMLTEPDEYIKGHKSFGCTSSLTTGANFQTPMDTVVVFSAANTALVRDLFQSQMRVRNLTDNLMYYYSYSYTKNESAFPVFSKTSLRRWVDGREVMGPKDLKEMVATIGSLSTLPKWAQELWVYNQQERNVSTYKHTLMFNEYLKLCGYNVTELEEEDDGYVLTKLPPPMDPELQFYHIDDISREVYEERLKAWYDQALAPEEADEMSKYHVCNVMMAPASESAQAFLFSRYVKNAASIDSKLAHVSHELGLAPIGKLSDHGFHDLPNKGKLEWTAAIVKQLDIEHTQDVGALITRKNLQSTCELLLDNIDHVKVVFKLGPSQSGISTLNSIFRHIGFTMVSQKERTRKRTGDKFVEAGDFVVSKDVRNDYSGYCINYLVCKHLEKWMIGLFESNESHQTHQPAVLPGGDHPFTASQP